jgi:hypothetical protein
VAALEKKAFMDWVSLGKVSIKRESYKVEDTLCEMFGSAASRTTDKKSSLNSM